MDSDNYENLYCGDDDDYRVYCEICDKICIERYYKSHFKSQSHTNIVCKRERIKKTH